MFLLSDQWARCLSIASSRTPDNKVFLRWGAFFFGSVSFGQTKEMNALAAAK